MSIEKTIFGTTKDGREVTAYTLRNIRGMRVKLSAVPEQRSYLWR